MYLWYLLISLPLLPVSLISLTCFAVYKGIVFAILKLKHGKDLTTITSIDSFFTLRKFQDAFSHIIIIVNSKASEEDLKRKLMEVLDDKIIKNVEHFKKIHSSLHSFMGYQFLLKEEVEVDDIVTMVDVEKDGYESINHLLHEYSIKPLPKQNKLLFEMIIVKSSKEWRIRNNLKVEQIPLLVRMHHVLGDGLSTMNLFIQLIGDDKVVLDEVVETFNRRDISKCWMRFLQNIHMFLLFPGFFIYNGIQMFNYNKRFGHNKMFEGSGKPYFASKVGDDELLDRVKSLKREIGNYSFNEILFTAISAALHNHLRKKNNKIPTTIGAATTATQHLENVNKNGLPLLINQFAFATFEFPIEIGSESTLERINAIKKNIRSPDTLINFMIIRFVLWYLLGLFPSCINLILSKVKRVSLGISNLPGVRRITVLNGMKIDEAYFFMLTGEKDMAAVRHFWACFNHTFMAVSI